MSSSLGRQKLSALKVVPPSFVYGDEKHPKITSVFQLLPEYKKQQEEAKKMNQIANSRNNLLYKGNYFNTFSNG